MLHSWLGPRILGSTNSTFEKALFGHFFTTVFIDKSLPPTFLLLSTSRAKKVKNHLSYTITMLPFSLITITIVSRIGAGVKRPWSPSRSPIYKSLELAMEPQPLQSMTRSSTANLTQNKKSSCAITLSLVSTGRLGSGWLKTRLGFLNKFRNSAQTCRVGRNLRCSLCVWSSDVAATFRALFWKKVPVHLATQQTNYLLQLNSFFLRIFKSNTQGKHLLKKLLEFSKKSLSDWHKN